jgi:hypothetical protein
MKRPGLERVQWGEAVEDFIRRHGTEKPRWAIFCTYEINLDELSRSIVPLLSRRGRVFRAVVLSDADTLEEALQSSKGSMPNGVNLHKIFMKKGGVFHPKLVFLRAGSETRVCFGSANLTAGGMGSKLELWTYSDDSDVVAGTVRFLRQLPDTQELTMDPTAARSIRRATSSVVDSRRTSVVWSSLDEPFSRRIRRTSDRLALQATVISPLYAGEGGLKAARAAIPASEINIYTSSSPAIPKSVIPKESVWEYRPSDATCETDEELDAWPPELHAKFYLFRRRRKTVAWLGSANFTAQALTRSVAKGGNVELLVRTEISKGQMAALDADLGKLFKQASGSQAQSSPRPFVPKRSRATVLSCELVGNQVHSRLIVYSTQQKGEVVIQNTEKHGRVRIAISNGRGVLDGKKLHKLIPGFDFTDRRPIILYQLVGGKLFPIIVNYPHVPSDEVAGIDSQAPLDALLDDWTGIRVANGAEGDPGTEKDNRRRTRDYDDDDERKVGREVEQRLDEVKHQGEIDQLAVKTALLKKLVIRATKAGRYRDVMLREALNALLKAAPHHLFNAIKELFRDINAAKSP